MSRGPSERAGRREGDECDEGDRRRGGRTGDGQVTEEYEGAWS